MMTPLLPNAPRPGWTAGLTIGVPELDEHHRQLIARINALLDARDEPARFVALLRGIEIYATGIHFPAEEKCMTAYHCPASRVNKIAHANIARKTHKAIGDIEAALSTDEVRQAIEGIAWVLYDWFWAHITRVDPHLLGCVLRHRPAPAGEPTPS